MTEGDAPPSLPSLPLRLAQLFVAPAELFSALARRPVWVGALLAVLACSLLATALIPAEVLREMLAGRAPPEATPEQVEGMVGMARTLILATSLVVIPIMAALTAGLLILIYNFFLGGEASYRQLLSATSHALFIWGVGQLVTLGVIVAAGDADATLSLHLLAPFLEEGSFLHRFLQSVELFGLWTAVVLGVAVSRIYPRREAGTSAAVIVALYLALQATGAMVARLTGT